MRTIRQMISMIFIIIFLSACVATKQIETQNVHPALTATPLPERSATHPPFPTFTPTNTLPASEPVLSGFPYVSALNDALPKEDLILARHYYADTVGHIQGDEFCYDVGIYDDNTYVVISCIEGYAYPAPRGTLDETQSKYLHRWVESFQSFDEANIHGLLRFTGRGEIVPDYADQVSMQAMIGELEWAAHEYVHRGGMPPVVFSTREVLSHRLNKWLDDKSIRNFEAVNFPDSCLGAPDPNEDCGQTPVQGFRIQFVVDGLLYEYHTDVFGYDIRSFGEPLIAPTQAPGG